MKNELRILIELLKSHEAFGITSLVYLPHTYSGNGNKIRKTKHEAVLIRSGEELSGCIENVPEELITEVNNLKEKTGLPEIITSTSLYNYNEYILFRTYEQYHLIDFEKEVR